MPPTGALPNIGYDPFGSVKSPLVTGCTMSGPPPAVSAFKENQAISEALDRLASVIGQLTEHLDPILRPQPPSADHCGANPVLGPLASPLVSGLRQNVMRVEDFIDRLATLRGRAEI